MTQTRAAAQPNPTHARLARVTCITVAVATALAVLAADAEGQRRREQRPETLRGSRASVEKMYHFAQRHRYPFYLTPANVDGAVASGRLVPLTGDSTYELTRGVGFSYATREAKQFITAFAPQYLHACGTPLVVTSAARPKSRQPRNANPQSVHPTGIAVDLRRPYPGPCLTWLRSALSDLERRGIIEATEERHPVHMHLAVLAAPGSRVVLPNLIRGTVAAARVPVTPPSPAGITTVSAGDVSLPPLGKRTYVVRPGDTLYDIANRMGVSVQALAEANGRSDRKLLKPGITLVVPQRGAK